MLPGRGAGNSSRQPLRRTVTTLSGVFGSHAHRSLALVATASLFRGGFVAGNYVALPGFQLEAAHSISSANCAHGRAIVLSQLRQRITDLSYV